MRDLGYSDGDYFALLLVIEFGYTKGREFFLQVETGCENLEARNVELSKR
jgi:hypothetical protein